VLANGFALLQRFIRMRRDDALGCQHREPQQLRDVFCIDSSLCHLKEVATKFIVKSARNASMLRICLLFLQGDEKVVKQIYFDFWGVVCSQYKVNQNC